MIKIEATTLTDEEFQKFRSGVRVQYGAETQCRRCKRIRGTLTEANS